MIIQALDKDYLVIKRGSFDERVERYLCKCSVDSEIYMLILIKDRQLIHDVAEYITAAANSEKFLDLHSCFSSEDGFCVVCRHVMGRSLKNKIRYEYLALEERLAIGRKILEKIILQNLPAYFLCDTLFSETVVVHENLDIGFTYELIDLDHFKEYGMEQAMERIAAIMEELFHEEVGKNMLPPLLEFCHNLNTHHLRNYMDIFQAYEKTCETIQGMAPEEREIPRTWLFRQWAKIVRLGKPLKKIAAAILLILAIVWLMYVIGRPEPLQKGQNVYDYIGTLPIQQEKEVIKK
ncbi:hypothetical protein LQZ18_03880 [Lachnospiraceae bacterium ZAX-1]